MRGRRMLYGAAGLVAGVLVLTLLYIPLRWLFGTWVAQAVVCALASAGLFSRAPESPADRYRDEVRRQRRRERNRVT